MKKGLKMDGVFLMHASFKKSSQQNGKVNAIQVTLKNLMR
ncbi:hypothetical protein MY7_0279 [Bacillus sp. 5B6]|nr:hypothetical protein MY7_0279 [Bacillus sp. 5B6]